MMKHHASAEDLEFRRAFEACEIPAGDFDHAAHVRLAYVYLSAYPATQAAERMKGSLLNFLVHLGLGKAKYHETITRAWIMAVDHFMAGTPACDSASSFLAANPTLLDSTKMLRHYSPATLYSAMAREAFVSPDIRPIPSGGPT
jgi:hypothetical protein